MEVQFIDHIKKNNLFDNSHNLLLAYSAGVDSSVLFNLFLNCKYKFSVAHCNYKLRGQHSDNDQRFIIEKQKYIKSNIILENLIYQKLILKNLNQFK